MLKIKIGYKKIVETFQKPTINVDLVMQAIQEYAEENGITLDILKIYHYGSSYTGNFGKTHTDTYGDIDIGVIVSSELDENAWYDSQQYEELKSQDYDVSLTNEDKEIWEPREMIWSK